MHRETGAYHKKFLGHNQKWLTRLQKCEILLIAIIRSVEYNSKK